MDFSEAASVIVREIDHRGNLLLLTQEVLDAISKQVIIILGASNQLLYFREKECVFETTCTTSENGFGEKANSLQSPRGLHQVGTIIGKEGPLFRRIYQKKVCDELVEEGKFGEIRKGIVGRVIVLEGKEPGFNDDTYQRGVYIHGTPNTWFWQDYSLDGSINLKRSAGCFGLRPTIIQHFCDSILPDNPQYIPVYITDKY